MARNIAENIVRWGDRLLGVRFGWFLKNAGWLNLEKAVRAVGELGIVVIIARATSLSAVGQYELLMSIYLLMSMLAITGFNASLLRALAQGFDGTLKEVVRLSWRWSMVGVVVILVVGWGFYRRSYLDVGTGLLLAAPVFPIYAVLKKWDVVLQAKERFAERAVNYLVLAAANLGSTVAALLIWRESVVAIFMAMVVSTALFNVFFFRRAARLLTNDAVEKGWMKSGYKLFLSELFTIMYAKVDKLVLAAWLGVEALAVYALAIKFGEGIKLVVGGMISVYIPKIYRRGTEAVLVWYRSYRWRIVVLMVAGLGVVWLAMPAIVRWLFGSPYEASIWYGQLYLLIVPAHLAASIWGYLLILERRELAFVLCGVGAGVVNLALYLFLIPLVGILGAVVGSIGYYVVLALAYYWAWHRRQPVVQD